MESAPQREAHALQMEQALTEMRRPTITLQPLQDNTLHQRRKVGTVALPCTADPQRLNAEDEARVPPSQAPAPASLALAPASLVMVYTPAVLFHRFYYGGYSNAGQHPDGGPGPAKLVNIDVAEEKPGVIHKFSAHKILSFYTYSVRTEFVSFLNLFHFLQELSQHCN